MEAVAQTSRQAQELKGSEPFTEAEAWALFDKTAWLYMGMSGHDFLSRLASGDFGDADSRPKVMRVASLIPLVRKIGARQKSR